MEVLVRRACHDDAETLTKIAMLSKQSNGYDDAFMAACADELLITPDLLDAHEYWVAEGHQICGFVCLEVDLDHSAGTVSSFFIDPAWQQRGIGRQLWQTIEASACEKGLKLLRLHSDPEAENFYTGLGFSTIGRVPSGSIPGRTLPHMEMWLNSD